MEASSCVAEKGERRAGNPGLAAWVQSGWVLWKVEENQN